MSHALQPQQKGAHQQHKGHEAGHRVTRQANEMCRTGTVAHRTVGKRFARLHGNLPQGQVAQLLHSGLDVVFFPHGNATTGQNQVMGLRGCSQRSHGGLALIGNDAHVRHLATQACEQSTQEKPVRVIDGTWRHGLGRHSAGHDQLIPRGKQGHTGAPSHSQLSVPQAGGQAQLGRPQSLTSRQHLCTTGHVFASAADPGTGFWHGFEAGSQLATAVGHDNVFLHHDGICPIGYRCSRENTCHCASLQRRARVSSGNALHHRQCNGGICPHQA